MESEAWRIRRHLYSAIREDAQEGLWLQWNFRERDYALDPSRDKLAAECRSFLVVTAGVVEIHIL